MTRKKGREEEGRREAEREGKKKKIGVLRLSKRYRDVDLQIFILPTV